MTTANDITITANILPGNTDAAELESQKVSDIFAPWIELMNAHPASDTSWTTHLTDDQRIQLRKDIADAAFYASLTALRAAASARQLIAFDEPAVNRDALSTLGIARGAIELAESLAGNSLPVMGDA